VIDRPVVGVSALEALAVSVLEGADSTVRVVAPWMDAQRGEVFAAFYSRDQRVGGVVASADPVVGTPAVLLTALSPRLIEHIVFVGDGAWRYQAEIAEFTGQSARVAAAPTALAPFIARVGQKLAARGQAGPPHALQPLYVRRSDAELERARKSSMPSSLSNDEPSSSRNDLPREEL
jgi:tRNA A37 threonylcarbamoyladenosine modification protein TsaB